MNGILYGLNGAWSGGENVDVFFFLKKELRLMKFWPHT